MTDDIAPCIQDTNSSTQNPEAKKQNQEGVESSDCCAKHSKTSCANSSIKLNQDALPSNETQYSKENRVDSGYSTKSESRKAAQKKSLKQIALFFCIGGGISLAELLGFFILYKFCGIHYILASLLMFVIASAVGVWLYRHFVFGETHLHSDVEIGLTYLINTIGIGLNTIILWLCVEFLGFEAIAAKILASILVAFYGFYARKILIYKRSVYND